MPVIQHNFDSIALYHKPSGDATLVTAKEGEPHINSRVLCEVDKEWVNLMAQVVDIFNDLASSVDKPNPRL